jgi:sialate O-acetylesterase
MQNEDTAGKLVACVGDSITYGYGVPGARDTESYPAFLEQLCHAAGTPIRTQNYGHNGACVLRNGKDPYDQTEEFRASLATRAQVVLMMLGTNDAAAYEDAESAQGWQPQRFKADLAALVDRYDNLPQAPLVVLVAPPCMKACKWGGHVPREVTQSVNACVRSLAGELGLPFADASEPTRDRPELLMDCYHPNAVGNAILAEHLFRALRAQGVL